MLALVSRGEAVPRGQPRSHGARAHRRTRRAAQRGAATWRRPKATQAEGRQRGAERPASPQRHNGIPDRAPQSTAVSARAREASVTADPRRGARGAGSWGRAVEHGRARQGSPRPNARRRDDEPDGERAASERDVRRRGRRRERRERLGGRRDGLYRRCVLRASRRGNGGRGGGRGEPESVQPAESRGARARGARAARAANGRPGRANGTEEPHDASWTDSVSNSYKEAAAGTDTDTRKTPTTATKMERGARTKRCPTAQQSQGRASNHPKRAIQTKAARQTTNSQ